VFAAEAHVFKPIPGKRRSYLEHLALTFMEVIAALEAEPGHYENLAVQCAWLHDVLEDTPRKYDDLMIKFGKEVADGVQALSKNKRVKRGDQMTDLIDRVLKQPPEISMVKLADRITHLRPPPDRWDRKKIEDYRKDACLILERLGHCNPYLAARMKAKIDAYARQES
jgi:(p)ppGpp synthase/HD superfamily hydrolase